MPDSIYTKDEAQESHARSILIEALRRADIPEYEAKEYQSVYWHSIKIGDTH